MARKGVDVRDELRRPIRRGGAAHAAADRDPDARRLALKRPEHQLAFDPAIEARRSDEHTSELQSLMRISYAVFRLKNNITLTLRHPHTSHPSRNLQVIIFNTLIY